MRDQQEDHELQAIRNTVAFGMDAEAFMRSPIGIYLQRRANQDIETALHALRTVDPTQPEDIRRLQNDVKCAENFLQWMGEAVTEGENAAKAFIETDN